jgi:hypothetical protein
MIPMVRQIVVRIPTILMRPNVQTPLLITCLAGSFRIFKQVLLEISEAFFVDVCIGESASGQDEAVCRLITHDFFPKKRSDIMNASHFHEMKAGF